MRSPSVRTIPTGPTADLPQHRAPIDDTNGWIETPSARAAIVDDDHLCSSRSQALDPRGDEAVPPSDQYLSARLAE
jgi:hypothetical protein